MRPLWFGVIASSAACALTTDLGGLSGGGGSPDATTAPDEAGPDPIAPPTEGGAGENGVDAGADGGFCARARATTPTLAACFDFDDNTTPKLPENVMNGRVELDAIAVSAPRALVATLDRGKAGRAYFVLDLHANPKRIVYSFDARLEDTNAYTELAALSYSQDTGYCIVIPSIGTHKLNIEVTCGGGANDFSEGHLVATDMLDDRWYGFRIDLDVANRKVAATLTSPAGDTRLLPPTPIDARFATGNLQAFLGMNYSVGTATGARLHLDNVTVDTP